MAVTNPDAPPHTRASQIIVPTDTPGFKFVRNIPLMGHAGDDYDSHAEVVYENCRVPQRTCSAQEGPASSSPRSGSARAASTTACAGSASASARST